MPFAAAALWLDQFRYTFAVPLLTSITSLITAPDGTDPKDPKVVALVLFGSKTRLAMVPTLLETWTIASPKIAATRSFLNCRVSTAQPCYHADMETNTGTDPDQTVTYALRWPFWLSEKAAEAANGRAMSVAAWLREAAQEKLQRDDKKGTRLMNIQPDAEDDGTIRAKWTIDGAATLAEAAQKAREFAAELQKLHDEGFVLRQPVEDDYGFYYKPA